MNKLFTFITLFLALTLVFAFAGPAPVQDDSQATQVMSKKSPGQFNSKAYVKKQMRLYDWLVSEAAPISAESVIRIELSEGDLDSLADFGCKTCSKSQLIKVGVTKPVNFETASNVSPMKVADGSLVWTLAAESKGAVAMRFHLTDVNLPENAGLFIYNSDGEAFGPYRGRGPNGTGDFWTNTVSGPLAYLQVHHYGPANKTETKGLYFKVADVAHMGEKFLEPFFEKPFDEARQTETTEAFCAFNASCVLDASCYSLAAINDAKNAIAHMQFVSGASVYICSGGLLNNTSNDLTPYFLTANHCISTSTEASSLECYWRFWTSSCGGACYNPSGAVPRTLGAVIRGTNATSDYTLMELSQNPPAGSVFMGWNANAVAYSNGTMLYRVSHPQGAPQAYSNQEVDTSTTTCGSWPRGNWIYSTGVTGATEGGSSGSPVLNSSGQVVGQLSGACGYNLNDVCDHDANATVDGALAAYYSQVSQYLDPGTTPPVGDDMHVSSITVSRVGWWWWYYGRAQVTIVDEGNSAVSGASVSGTFSNGITGSFTETTNASGVATLESDIYWSISAFRFCVTNVTLSGYSYDSSANVETCEDY